MENTEDNSPLYLGLDLSTQQLKVVVIDGKLQVLHEATVQYDSELPEFRTHGGVVTKGGRNLEVTAPPAMWLKALDLLLDRLRVGWGSSELFGRLRGISGAAQQHGCVFWQKGASETLAKLSASGFLHEQLASCFSLSQVPVWRDHSTTKQCEKLAEALGGNDNLSKITGSAAHERFTGAQICKIAETKPNVYSSTERISLVSSFLCSVFLGKYAALDWSDASGMNLLDIQTKEWSPKCLDACAPGLGSKLGEPCSSTSVLGPVAPYFVERFGINESCQVVAFTGDNPSSLAGLGLKSGELALSLGSSDTLFAWLPEHRELPGGRGHLLCNPVQPQDYMALLCFSNGSLTREKVRDRVSCGGTWDRFNQLLNSTPRGNFGNFAIFLDAPEPLFPEVPVGEHRFGQHGMPVSAFMSAETEVRALVEGQALARRAAVNRQLGLTTGPETRLIATGGASHNLGILQVYADVFNTPVYVQEATNSAAHGGALRAFHATLDPAQEFTDTVATLRDSQTPACTPYADAETIYNPMLEKFLDAVEKIKITPQK